MKAYLLQTGTRLEPFDDPVGEAFLGGETLTDAVGRALAATDVSVERVARSDDIPVSGDFLVLPDTLFFTRRAVREFLAVAAGRGGSLALGEGPATAYARPLQDVEQGDSSVGYDLFFVRGIEIPRGLDWPALQPFLRERSERIVLDPAPEVAWLPQSRPGPPRERTPLPRTTLMAADVRHWVHVLWLNHLLPWIRLREYWEDHPGWRRAWRSRGRNPYRRERRLSVVGERCDIHPTAVVEGSILGDRVTLGPFACVRDSIVADGVEIADHTKVLRCVVGAGCHLLTDSYFIGCTCYPESTLASFMLRNTVLGRRMFIASGVIFFDEPMLAPVSVMQAGKETGTDRWILGGCAGHGSVLGTRAIFLPGRAVPNDTMVVMRPGEGVAKLPASAEPLRPHVNHQGRVVPLDDVMPEWHPLEMERE